MKTSPIYEQAREKWLNEPTGRGVYISTNDSAKLIRSLLKSVFPGVKFSVRSSKYAGGSSIRIAWMDGPTSKLVDAYVQPFGGSGFDGMIDMKYSIEAWLYPNGTASFRKTNGTAGSAGVVPDDQDEPTRAGAIPVSFLVDYIFTERSYSVEAWERVLKAYSVKWADELAEAISDGKVYVEDANGWIAVKNADSYKSDAPGPNPFWGSVTLRQMADRRMLPDYMPQAA